MLDAFCSSLKIPSHAGVGSIATIVGSCGPAGFIRIDRKLVVILWWPAPPVLLRPSSNLAHSISHYRIMGIRTREIVAERIVDVVTRGSGINQKLGTARP